VDPGSGRIGAILTDPDPDPGAADPEPGLDPYPFQPNVKLTYIFIKCQYKSQIMIHMTLTRML